ncbi:MAG: TolC family protein, partial [Saprospiraceae bacterium]|nr:TolC family protein [Saprospiraceae bacterium]
PHLQIIEAHKDLALSKIETEKAKLLPQINTGLKLQTAFGNYPLFGYQVGVNVPLFRKAYNGRIQAAKIEVMVQEEALKTEQLKLNRTISELIYRYDHQRTILQFLEEELSPLVNNQSIANLAAYQEGETGYLEYLDSLEHVVKVKQQFLEAVYQYNILKIELAYWLGK